MQLCTILNKYGVKTLQTRASEFLYQTSTRLTYTIFIIDATLGDQVEDRRENPFAGSDFFVLLFTCIGRPG